MAKKRFRSIRADRLLFSDMAERLPNPDLHRLTEAAHFGHVDAFLSHSWNDDPNMKWAALQSWREDFKRRNRGREPKLWIDKYCVDQNNIEKSIQYLPVYLA